MDSYDKFLNDIGSYDVVYRDVKVEDQKGVNDYINMILFFEEYVNSIEVYTDMWLSTVNECLYSPICAYEACIVNGNKYYIIIGIGD